MKWQKKFRQSCLQHHNFGDTFIIFLKVISLNYDVNHAKAIQGGF